MSSISNISGLALANAIGPGLAQEEGSPDSTLSTFPTAPQSPIGDQFVGQPAPMSQPVAPPPINMTPIPPPGPVSGAQNNIPQPPPNFEENLRQLGVRDRNGNDVVSDETVAQMKRYLVEVFRPELGDSNGNFSILCEDNGTAIIPGRNGTRFIEVVVPTGAPAGLPQNVTRRLCLPPPQ